MDKINELSPQDLLSLKIRDPFKMPFILEDIKPKTELERVLLEQIKMRAVVTGPKATRALVQTPDLKHYTVKIGDKIGTKNGVIRNILTDKIEIEEKIVNVLGQEESVTSVIKMDLDDERKGL